MVKKTSSAGAEGETCRPPIGGAPKTEWRKRGENVGRGVGVQLRSGL